VVVAAGMYKEFARAGSCLFLSYCVAFVFFEFVVVICCFFV